MNRRYRVLLFAGILALGCMSKTVKARPLQMTKKHGIVFLPALVSGVLVIIDRFRRSQSTLLTLVEGVCGGLGILGCPATPSQYRVGKARER